MTAPLRYLKWDACCVQLAIRVLRHLKLCTGIVQGERENLASRSMRLEPTPADAKVNRKHGLKSAMHNLALSDRVVHTCLVVFVFPMISSLISPPLFGLSTRSNVRPRRVSTCNTLSTIIQHALPRLELLKMHSHQRHHGFMARAKKGVVR